MEHSITVRANWRTIFRSEEGDATNVDLVDYHQRAGWGGNDDYKPAHPGLSVRHDCIEPLGMTITEAAEDWA